MRAIVEFEWRKRVPVGDTLRMRAGRGKRTVQRKRSSQRKRADDRKRAGRGKRTVQRKRAADRKRAAHPKRAADRKRTAGRKAFRSRVVRSVSRTTETGIRGVDGGDPAGTSKAMCLIY